MFLQYENKQDKETILTKKFNTNINLIDGQKNNKNQLYYGDNYNVLRYLLDEMKLKEKIDLIYIDPPYSTNTIFRISENRANTISSSTSDAIAYKDTLKGKDYLEFLRERLILLHELLSKKGSIYLHIDYKIGHYVKLIMDEIFGIENFRNDITRIKCNPKNFKRKGYGNIKDLILFYSKDKKFTWNYPTVPFNNEDIERLYTKIDENGERYTTVPLHAPGETRNGETGGEWRGLYPPKGRHWRVSPKELDKLEEDGLIEWSKNGNPRKKNYAKDMVKKGKPMQDIWEYKDKSSPTYPTEKNIDMIKNIIEASSNKSDLVLDCFAGSGTTLLAAQELDRNWIGIDNSSKAIEVIKKRLGNYVDSFNFYKEEKK